MPTPGDNPITKPSEDVLNRQGVAGALANSVRSADASAGYVLGVLGPWGSGKTSLINLTRELLAKEPSLPVLDFNPWMFSGAEQLVDVFFAEIAAQLRLKGPKLQTVAKNIQKYSKLLSPLAPIPFIGAWAERTEKTADTLASWVGDQRPSVLELRTELTKELADLDRPIIVVIDDIDRLSTGEIREIFKLVRLTASFPNIIYLLSFDRERVESALQEVGISGRDYLEKIVQTSFDLPRVPDKLLMKAYLQAVDAAIEATGAKIRFDEVLWPDVLAEIIWPLVSTMRDVRRYCASIHGTISELEDKIQVADILALESIRIFLPDVFEALRSAQGALTSTRDLEFGAYGRSENAEFQALIDTLVEPAKAENREATATALINRLFPAAQRYIGGSNYGSNWKSTWLKERRVAHEDFLRLYFERVAGEAIGPFETAEQIFLVMQEGGDIKARLDAIPKDKLEDVISSLEVWEREYPLGAIPSAIVELLNKIKDIPDRPRGMFDLGDSSLIVTRVVLRMLRVVDDEARVAEIVRDALPQITRPSDQLQLIELVGHIQNAGHKLISAEDAQTFEREWASQVVTLEQGRLESDQHVVQIFMAAKSFGETLPKLKLTPKLVRAMLMDARSETRGQTIGSRAVRRTYRLWWDGLVTVAGSEDELRAGIDALAESELAADEDLTKTISMARKYLDGWRPDDYSSADEND